jgi:hypothetical protein
MNLFDAMRAAANAENAGGATTAENIAYWIFCQLPLRRGFKQVDVHETPTTCASFVQ